MKKPVVVFDVNETLLDLAPVAEVFDGAFGDRSAAAEWFTRMLELSWVATITDAYRPFTELGAAAVEMVGSARGVTVGSEAVAAVMEAMRSLPPHPDAAEGLQFLDQAGFRLAALTNSPPGAAHAQLEHAGLAASFETIMSVEMVRSFKPDGRVYEAAAARLEVDAGDMVMVAAHAWDIAGAMAVGCRGAFVARPGRVLSPLQPAPDFVGSDVADVARLIVAELG